MGESVPLAAPRFRKRIGTELWPYGMGESVPYGDVHGLHDHAGRGEQNGLSHENSPCDRLDRPFFLGNHLARSYSHRVSKIGRTGFKGVKRNGHVKMIDLILQGHELSTTI